MFTKTFWLDAGERAIKTFAQALLSVLTVAGVTVLTLDWADTLAIAGTATLASVLTSVVTAKFTSNDTASLVEEVVYDPHTNVGLE